MGLYDSVDRGKPKPKRLTGPIALCCAMFLLFGGLTYWACHYQFRFHAFISDLTDSTRDARRTETFRVTVNESETDVHLQTMYVASSDSPNGPFSDAKELIKPFSIDSHVVENEEGLFIFYSTNDYTGDRIGTYVCVDKMPDPEHVAGNPVPVVKPTLDQEIYMRNRFGDGKDWHTLEGAFYFKEGDYHYVIYSGNCYSSPYYYLGYAVAKTDETDLTKIKFKKYPSENVYAPLIARNDFEEGTGHNSVIKYKGEYYVVYHGRDKGVTEADGEDNRTARICKLIVDKEKLTAIRKENSL